MSSVLEAIIKNKKLEIDSGKYSTSAVNLDSSSRSLEDSIISRNPGLILECKAASPSKGLIVENYQPQVLVRAYQPFAAAISVLTDEKYFQGSMQHLKQVSEITELPVLCKDFFISKQQIICARAHGADAILLMMSVVDDVQYKDLALQAKLLGIDVLTEVRDETELERAIQLDAQIIGINNRNLDTLKIDMKTTKRLSRKIPKHSLLISESGYSTREQLLDSFNNERSADGFLVGSHLSGAGNIDMAVRKLIFGEVKICGLKRLEDAQLAYQNGASYGGLIFAERSPRLISIEQAKEMVTAVALKWVGVFTQKPLQEIANIAKQLKLSAVQIHWNASPQQIKELRGSLEHCCEIWQVIRIKLKTDKLVESLETNSLVDKFLIEPEGPLQGGNGIEFDWSLLQKLAIDTSKIIIAGGIDPDNIQNARATGAAIIDVNSGVEESPSIKSAKKIRQLFKQLLPGKRL